jgi:hypothetical protein
MLGKHPDVPNETPVELVARRPLFELRFQAWISSGQHRPVGAEQVSRQSQQQSRDVIGR